MPGHCLTVALIGEVFLDVSGEERLQRRLREAWERGARLAVLPEPALNPWSPSSSRRVAGDAEPPSGPRHCAQCLAACEAGLGLLGGAIVTDPVTGRRHNTALFFGADGAVVLRYRKMHLPEEEGFWETSHYAPGQEPPVASDALGPRLGIQICSDANRLVGGQLLAAQGVDIILAPRATSVASAANWRLAYRALALTSAAFVVSVNRPGPEAGAPSYVVSPTGTVLLETVDPLAVLTLDLNEVVSARRGYPGYLEFPAAAYARAWQRLTGT